MSRAYVIATLDTKGEEALFVAGKLRAAGAETVVVDVGVKESPSAHAEVSREEVASFHPDGAAAVLATADRGEAVAKMSEALVRYLVREQAAGKLAGAIGLGGSGGTALVAPALRALPIGVPKAIVSTMASGNTRPYVGSADIAMFYSVVDVAGLNRVSRRVLANAAHALAGMIARLETGKNEAPTVGMTMFGVTTPCVTAARTALEAVGVECLVFHATGTGGQAMENLVDGKALDALLDLTTTEVADEIVGGVLTAGPLRFDAMVRTGVPTVMSVGACDMVNFGAMDSVPERFRRRNLHVHNPQVTLMRTTSDENRKIGEFIAAKVRGMKGPFRMLLPERGVSALDAEGKPFFDPEADAALFAAIEQGLPDHDVRRLPLHINDPEFAAEAVKAHHELMKKK